MYIIIIGLGKVGQLLTKYLADEGHDVVVIDTNPQKVESIVNIYDVMGICGNGANFDILQSAEVERADAVISVTTSDELNILSGLIAHKEGAKTVIARVRNPDYSAQQSYIREQLGFDMIVNPEQAAADEITRMIMFPPAAKIDTFVKGRVELIELKIDKKIKLHDVALSQLSKVTKANVLICAVCRQEEVFIPDGSFVLKKGDHIFVTGLHKDLTRFCIDTGFMSAKIKNVSIIGGSKITYYLTKQLAVLGIKTKIIENNHQRCIELSQKMPYSVVIEGDGSDKDVLLEEGVQLSDAIVTLTGMDEQNIILGLMAKTLGVKKAIAKVNHISASNFIDQLDVDNIVDPKSIVASQIVGYLRSKFSLDEQSSVVTLHKVVNEQVEALEFVVNENTKHTGIPLSQLHTKKNILIGGILRDYKLLIPKGQDTLEVGDRVIIIAYDIILNKLNDIFEDGYYE
ncbi:MAG: Trk system potassium transporter TrkA [Erysipelotrichaceae bacterium]|nr:Trk system potassium transporter TrkA [Erysipelotrichaceae bacterium]